MAFNPHYRVSLGNCLKVYIDNLGTYAPDELGNLSIFRGVSLSRTRLVTHLLAHRITLLLIRL